MQIPTIYIAPSDKGGRGVFSTKNLPAGCVLEVSPVLVLKPKERKALDGTKLQHYIFEWGVTKRQAAVAFGYVSMYNHDYNSNCEYEMDYEMETMTVKTVRAVKKGEELCINYNATPTDTTPIWFHATVK